MRSYLFITFSLLMSCNSYALGLNTGADVLEACETAQLFLAGNSEDSRKAESCVHFLMGFDYGQSVTSLSREQTTLYCNPKGSNISSMVSTVVNGLKSDKSYHDAPAGIAVWKALSSAWTCE